MKSKFKLCIILAGLLLVLSSCFPLYPYAYGNQYGYGGQVYRNGYGYGPVVRHHRHHYAYRPYGELGYNSPR